MVGIFRNSLPSLQLINMCQLSQLSSSDNIVRAMYTVQSRTCSHGFNKSVSLQIYKQNLVFLPELFAKTFDS